MMKKFIIGLLCGIALSAATAVTASDTVKTFLTRVTMDFHINGEQSNVNSDQMAVITYKDRIYVPLRFFSEKIGATVDYTLPQYKGGIPRVDMFYEDNSNFIIKDPSGSVSIGHVKLDFGDKADRSNNKPTIDGIVKLEKAIGKEQEVILLVKDKNNIVIAESEIIQSNGKHINQFQVGDVRTFKSNYPYISASDDYHIEIKIIDSSAWMYKQEGYYAQQDSPIDITLGTNAPLSEPISKGGTIDVLLTVANTSDHALKIQSAQFEILLPGEDGDAIKKTEILKEQIIPGNGGAMTTSLTWQANVPTGTYYIRLKEPFSFSYEEEGSLKEYYAYGDMWTAFPIQVK
jgi:hypothetical protein